MGVGGGGGTRNVQRAPIYTPPKFHIAPENGWWEDNFSFLGWYLFRGELLNFRCYITIRPKHPAMNPGSVPKENSKVHILSPLQSKLEQPEVK